MDANQTFNFELVSPERKLMSEPAWQVIVPGEEGYFGVLAGHMSLMAAIKPGVIEVFSKQGDAPRKIFISGGFADVTATNCTILAEQAINLSDLNVVAIEQDINNLNDEIKVSSSSMEKSVLEKKLALATIKLNAAQSA